MTDASAFIPHRGAMMLISAVRDVSVNSRNDGNGANDGAGPSAETVHDVTLDEPCYAQWGLTEGPWPRTLMTEFLGQTAALLCACANAGRTEQSPLFARAENAIFLGDAFPGDRVIGRATIERTIGPASFVRASARVGDRVLCTIDQATIFYTEKSGTSRTRTTKEKHHE